jgi:PAS domain S-box-containing protein
MNIANNLRFKLVIFSILIEGIALTLLILNADRLILNHLSSQSYKQIDTMKSNFQATLLPLLVERDYATIDALLDKYTHSKDISYMFITKDKNIISYANWQKEKQIPSQDISINNDKNIFNTSVDIVFAKQIYGTVYFGVNTSYLQQAQAELKFQSLIIALIEIILSTLLLLSIGYLLTKHLSTLTDAAKKIADNDFDIDINIKTKDEIGLLAKTFNAMAKKIKNQFHTITQQNELQKAVFDNMAHTLITMDTNGVITFINKQTEILLGYKDFELIGKNYLDLFHNKEQFIKRKKQFEQELSETIVSDFKVLTIKTDKGMENKHHWEYRKKDHTKIIVKLTISALYDEDNSIYGYIAVAEDNTEKYLLQQSLEEEIHRVKTILDNAGDFIHVLDHHGNLVFHSKSFREALGYTEEEAKKLNVNEWDKNFDPKTMLQILLDNPKIFEAIHTKKDGSSFFVEVKTNGVIFDGKQYLYSVSRDITEKKKTEVEIQQKDIMLQEQAKLAAMGEMIDSIAHQWKQPLSVISTNISSLQLKYDLENLKADDIDKTTSSIMNAIDYMSATIDDFKNFFNPNKQKSRFKINTTFEKIFNLLKSKFRKHSILLINEIEPITLHNYENELVQVLINILNNAADALEDSHHEVKLIFIKTYKENENIYISIKDNAGGISNQIIDKVFEARFTTKEKKNGTGIGLYINKKIIEESLKGTITVKNESFIYEDNEYKGANFTIILNSDC